MLPYGIGSSAVVITAIVVGWDYLHVHCHSLCCVRFRGGKSTKSDRSNIRFPFRIIFMFNHPVKKASSTIEFNDEPIFKTKK